MTSTSTRLLSLILSSVDASKLSDTAIDRLGNVEALTAADLGMSSLDRIGLLKRIADEFGADIPPDAVAHVQSIGDFAAYLDR